MVEVSLCGITCVASNGAMIGKRFADAVGRIRAGKVHGDGLLSSRAFAENNAHPIDIHSAKLVV